MGATNFDGPLYSTGDLQQITAALAGSSAYAVPDPNPDASPSVFFQGQAMPDVRMFVNKDKIQGFTGVVAAFAGQPALYSADQIPAATQTNNIAAAQGATNGVPMTLATAIAVGIAPNIPIVPFSGALNGAAPVTAAIALDFGFAFGNCSAGSATITVADSTQFLVGMPLVIGGVGNAAGTIPLLTQVATIPTATSITVNASYVPAATNATAPIGTGNIWGPSENGFPIPTAAMPAMAKGPGLFLDPTQSLARGIRIVGASGGAGGNFLVSGWDIYGQPMTQLVTVAAGASTGYTLKAFKYIASVVPQFTDASHNYTVGTSDVFGFAFFSNRWEYRNDYYAATLAPSATGWLTGVTTSPATNLTGDVRGTLQVSAIGGGSGLSGGASTNGTISNLAMSGNRLVLAQRMPLFNVIRGTISNPVPFFGQTQA